MTPKEESRHLRKFANKITKVPKEIKPTPIEYFIGGKKEYEVNTDSDISKFGQIPNFKLDGVPE